MSKHVQYLLTTISFSIVRAAKVIRAASKSSKSGKSSKSSTKDREEPAKEPAKEPKYDEVVPKEEKHLMLYVDASEGSASFNLDEHCDAGAYCVGTILTFKNSLYYDEHLKYPAGTNIGTCTIVAEYPAEYEHDPSIQKAYCTWSVIVDHEGEIAIQGVGTVGSLDGDVFLITAASGSYKGHEGTLLSKPTDETLLIYEYKFTFHYY